MTKTQARRLLIVNAHHYRRTQRCLPEVLTHLALRELNVVLASWSADWLDVLSDELTRPTHRSLTKELAVRRCLSSIEAKTGIEFPRPIVLAVGDLVGPTSRSRRARA